MSVLLQFDIATSIYILTDLEYISNLTFPIHVVLFPALELALDAFSQPLTVRNCEENSAPRITRKHPTQSLLSPAGERKRLRLSVGETDVDNGDVSKCMISPRIQELVDRFEQYNDSPQPQTTTTTTTCIPSAVVKEECADSDVPCSLPSERSESDCSELNRLRDSDDTEYFDYELSLLLPPPPPPPLHHSDYDSDVTVEGSEEFFPPLPDDEQLSIMGSLERVTSVTLSTEDQEKNEQFDDGGETEMERDDVMFLPSSMFSPDTPINLLLDGGGGGACSSNNIPQLLAYHITQSPHLMQQQPIKEKKILEEPITEQNSNVEGPITEQNNKNEPITEQKDKNEPITKQNDRNEPITEQNDGKEPITEQNDKNEPMAEQNDKNEPITEQKDKNEPIIEQKDKNEPITEQNDTSEPTTEQKDAHHEPIKSVLMSMLRSAHRLRRKNAFTGPRSDQQQQQQSQQQTQQQTQQQQQQQQQQKDDSDDDEVYDTRF